MNRSQSVTNDLIAQVATQSWKSELEKTSSKYHFIAAWAAIIFDPVFAFTDYINIPESWKQLFVIRLSISFIVLMMLVLRKKFKIPSYFIVAVTFLLISLQNAYTYSLIGNEDIIGHNLNYIALLIGASMFLLWELKYSLAMVLISIVATIFFLQLNSSLDIDQFLVQGGVLLAAVSFFMMVLIKTRYDLTVKEIKARLALQDSNEEIQAQNEQIMMQAEEIRSLTKTWKNLFRIARKNCRKKIRRLKNMLSSMRIN